MSTILSQPQPQPSSSSSVPFVSPSERRLQRFRDFLPPTTAMMTTTTSSMVDAATGHHYYHHNLQQQLQTRHPQQEVLLSPPLQNDIHEYRIVLSPDNMNNVNSNNQNHHVNSNNINNNRKPLQHQSLPLTTTTTALFHTNNINRHHHHHWQNIRPRPIQQSYSQQSSPQLQSTVPPTNVIEIDTSTKENQPLSLHGDQKTPEEKYTNEKDPNNNSTISSYSDEKYEVNDDHRNDFTTVGMPKIIAPIGTCTQRIFPSEKGNDDDDDDDDDDSQIMFYSPISVHTKDFYMTPGSIHQSRRRNKSSPFTLTPNTKRSMSSNNTTNSVITTTAISLTYEQIQSCTTLSALIHWRTRLLRTMNHSPNTKNKTPDSEEIRGTAGQVVTSRTNTTSSPKYGTNYPYLLRAIEHRMEELRNHDGTMIVMETNLQLEFDYPPNHDPTTTTTTTNNSTHPPIQNATASSVLSTSSSLVMSISTNDISGIQSGLDINANTTGGIHIAHDDNQNAKDDYHVTKAFGKNPISVPTSDANSTTDVGDCYQYDDKNAPTMDEVYEQMQHQHMVLSTTVLKELENSSMENHYYQQQIQEYQQRQPQRNNRRNDLIANSTTASTTTMQQLLQSVDQLRNENERLHEHLRKEMSIRQAAMERTKQVREEYSTVLHERDAEYHQLQHTLQQTSQQQYEKQLQLQHLLHQTQQKLQSIRTDRKILIETLQSTIQNNNQNSNMNKTKYNIGQQELPALSPSSISSLDKVDLHRLVLDFKKQNASQLLTIDTMMKVNNESDRMIQNAIEAKCKSENLLTQATHEQRRMMRENQMLLDEIQSLTAQLRASKQEMESYAEMANLERIHTYERTIEDLKQQLQYQQQKSAAKNLANAVPMNLYRSVVVEAKQYANQVQQQRLAIHTLENHILQLEQTQYQQPQLTKSNRILSFNPPSLQGFPSLISTTTFPQSTTAHIQNNDIHRQHYRTTLHAKHPRPKTPLPLKSSSRNNNASPILKVSSQNQPPPPLLKSALKKKMTETTEQLQPNKIKSTSTNPATTKAVHFNCSTDANEASKSTKMNEFRNATTTTTPKSSFRRTLASSGPTPSRLNYAVLPTTPSNKIDDSKDDTAVTPNTGGSSRNKENQLMRSQLRLSAVRSYGGRMGLQEKLRQVRRKHNVDDTKSPSVLPSKSAAHPTVRVESTENSTEGKVSIDNTTETNATKKQSAATKMPVAAPSELESYRTKLERMRIRPRQLGN